MNVYDELSVFFIKMIDENKTSLGFVLTSVVPVKTFNSLYNLFVKENGLVPIDKLDENKKIELVKECKNTGKSFTNTSLINAAKVLHTLKFIKDNS